MKIWIGYASEHSYNLVMIGHFVDVAKAKAVEKTFRRIEEQVRADIDSDEMKLGWEREERFSDRMRALLDELKVYSLSPGEIENFAYSYDLSQNGSALRVTTDEGEVSGFLKLMIDGGAKVEVYSAHDYPDDEKVDRNEP